MFDFSIITSLDSPRCDQPLVVVVDRHGEDLLGVVLADDVLVQLPHDVPRRGDFHEGLFAAPAAAPLLLEDRLAQVDALAADVDVAGPLDQGPYVAIALAAKGAEGVLLGGPAATASCVEIPSSWHTDSLLGFTCRIRPWQGASEGEKPGVARRAEPNEWLAGPDRALRM